MKRTITDPEELAFIEDYKKKVQSGFYPVQMICADACVFSHGKVLLVQRKFNPGKGLWALPGGFVNTNERLEQAAVRECLEETGVQVDPYWWGFGSQYFDDPERSSRGRILTHVFGYEVPDMCMVLARAGDDAADVRWADLSELKDEDLHDDHFEIIQRMERLRLKYKKD